VVPWSLQAHFLGGVFCSRKCVRAFLIETLETLEALDTPASVTMIADLHALNLEVARTLAEVSAE